MRQNVDISALNSVGDRLEVVIENTPVIVLKSADNEYVAFNAHCPHGSYSFQSGFYNASRSLITCEKHGYKFCVLDGKNVTGEGYHLKTYLVIKEGNNYFVEFE